MGMAKGDTIPTIENANIPTFYVDGCLSVDIRDGNVRITYFEYRRIAGVMSKCPSFDVVGPLSGLQQKLEMSQQAIKTEKTHSSLEARWRLMETL